MDAEIQANYTQQLCAGCICAIHIKGIGYIAFSDKLNIISVSLMYW